MIGAAKVRRVARETGFREEVVEKVLYLSAIIERLRGHPDLKNAWVLKGGTAINLFYLEVPRLSIDIDINYIGSRELEAIRAARLSFGVRPPLHRDGPRVDRRKLARSMLRGVI